MGTIALKKGLDIPLSGTPDQALSEGNLIRRVALIGPDSPGMRPNLAVGVGDRVKLGQLLFTDRKREAIRYTSPGSGTVGAIHYGERRMFLSLVVELDGREDEVTFPSFRPEQLPDLSESAVRDQLLVSGLWTAVRTRPFGGVADPGIVPHSLFVTAMDTQPLAPDVAIVLEGRERDFVSGLQVLVRLTPGNVYVCQSPGSKIPVPDSDRIRVQAFAGPHPAGLPGTHIHFLDPLHRNKQVWVVEAQDVAAIGRLFLTGRLESNRIVSIAGPEVLRPRLVRTRLGASIDDLISGECVPGLRRVLSGSVLNGWQAEDPLAFLGRYHQQVTVLAEERTRRFLGWLDPGLNLFSVKNIVASRLLKKRRFAFTTAQHGGRRSIIPSGSYEKVMPLDILPTYLLRALAVDDVEEAEKLGCLELEEEDLALCTFVCSSKIDHGRNLRRVLNLIQKEG